MCRILASPAAVVSALFCLQGIETVRRDNCELVRKMVATSLDKILIERDEAGAIEYVKGVIRDLLMNKVDMSLLVVTKVGSYTS
jgi:DNA polymerase delta subunit 1